MFTACNDEANEVVEPVSVNSFEELVGTVEYGTATAEDLARIPAPGSTANAALSCNLNSDIGCSEARPSVVYYIETCANYSRTWPPTGGTATYYKSFIYYVDGDDDINLDQYEDDIQLHVDQIIAAEGGSAAFIEGNILSWPCSPNRSNVSNVIAYTVYR
ncbi:hypothetical protein AB9P05_17300 [Roseivirga sp. BDSF3-8]|uniref:hypothetical protein n=1 Tax=Roseivirga sp. BDSF3-8 TaxID=3241598 RepID=UPI003531D7C7